MYMKYEFECSENQIICMRFQLPLLSIWACDNEKYILKIMVLEDADAGNDNFLIENCALSENYQRMIIIVIVCLS